jgi:hypothetical protein
MDISVGQSFYSCSQLCVRARQGGRADPATATRPAAGRRAPANQESCPPTFASTRFASPCPRPAPPGSFLRSVSPPRRRSQPGCLVLGAWCLVLGVWCFVRPRARAAASVCRCSIACAQRRLCNTARRSPASPVRRLTASPALWTADRRLCTEGGPLCSHCCCFTQLRAARAPGAPAALVHGRRSPRSTPSPNLPAVRRNLQAWLQRDDFLLFSDVRCAPACASCPCR